MGKHSKNIVYKKKEIINNLIFLILFFIIIFGFNIGIKIRGQKNESLIENRALNKIPQFNISDFIKGKYQDNLEKSLSDQMIMSEIIKGIMTERKAETANFWQTKIASIFEKNENIDEIKETESTNADNKEKKKEVRHIKYRPISNNVYRYGNSEYMVFKYRSVEKNKEKIEQMAKVYNKHFENIDSYFYLVTTSKAINFNTVDETENPFLTYIKKTFNFKCDGLKIDSYEKYKEYFYQTDHHWNYKGSYQAYQDIIHMLLPEDEVLKPIDTKTYDVYFYGSNARTTSIYTNKEKFTVYKYKLPKYKTYINKNRARYDNMYLYDNNSYPKEKGYNHYAAYYGGDYAEVIYDYNQPEKENLLVIAPSYSNAINNLVASHFNKTYYIDLRHYKNEFGEEFNPEKYCKNNKIDKFLLLLSSDHLTNKKFLLSK